VDFEIPGQYRELVDSLRALRIVEGTSEIQRLVIARSPGL
jgi:alkylation response protein AidB-like acyl-CoA dehydrogenase